MYLTGIADEASQNIETQIEVTRQLGWNAIESRFINGKNIHDLSEEAFDRSAKHWMEAVFILTPSDPPSRIGEKMYATTFPSPRRRSTEPFPG
jgi:hypothetical protein